jgi:hypothetical protein
MKLRHLPDYIEIKLDKLYLVLEDPNTEIENLYILIPDDMYEINEESHDNRVQQTEKS